MEISLLDKKIIITAWLEISSNRSIWNISPERKGGYLAIDRY